MARGRSAPSPEPPGCRGAAASRRVPPCLAPPRAGEDRNATLAATMGGGARPTRGPAGEGGPGMATEPSAGDRFLGVLKLDAPTYEAIRQDVAANGQA